MWATRPHLANIFEKLLDQKTFSCLRLVPYSQFVLTDSLLNASKLQVLLAVQFHTAKSALPTTPDKIQLLLLLLPLSSQIRPRCQSTEQSVFFQSTVLLKTECRRPHTKTRHNLPALQIPTPLQMYAVEQLPEYSPVRTASLPIPQFSAIEAISSETLLLSVEQHNEPSARGQFDLPPIQWIFE